MISVRIRLELDKSVGCLYAVLVVIELLNALNIQLPDTAVADLVHIVQRSVPVVEIADNAYRLCVRCPTPENDAVLFLVRAKEIISMRVLALVE